jgi:uncharacterized protein involved in exopolysaccharide biosynthesis
LQAPRVGGTIDAKSKKSGEKPFMKVIIASALAALVLGVGAAFILNAVQEPAFEAYATSGVRVGEPGNNLVGPTWSGNPSPDAASRL